MDAVRPSVQPVLHCRRLLLRPFGRGDAALLHPLLADWHVAGMLASVPWPLSRRDVEAYVAARLRGEADSDDWVLAAGDGVIGAVALRRPGSGEPPRLMPRLGYWIGRSYWGRGFAGEAVAALAAHAFRSYPQHPRIGAGVFLDNLPSRRLLEKLGFREAGRYATPSLSRGLAVETADMHLERADFERTAR